MMFSRLKTHLPALILAVIVGATLCSGELMSRLMRGPSYRGIPAILSNETGDGAWYHAVLRETADGGEPWNPILGEEAASKPPSPVFAEEVMSLPIRAGLDVHATVVLWRFILAFLASLVIYVVTLAVSRSRGFALSAAVAVPTLGWLIVPFFLPLSAFTLFDRPVHPQFEIPIVIAFMGCAVIALDKRGKDWLLVPASLLLGILIYSYVWAWTWGFAFLGLLFVERALRRDWRTACRLAGCAGAAVLVGVPAFIGLIQAVHTPGATDYAIRLGLVFGHGFADALVNLPLVFGLGVLMLSRRVLSPAIMRFAGVGIAATFIAANQQLITGRAFQPDHYVLLVGAPLVLWSLLWAIWTRIAMRGQIVRSAMVVATVLIGVGVQLVMQYRIAFAAIAIAKPIQPLTEVIQYLDVQNPSGAVVFMNQQTGILLPALSRHKLWWQTYALAAPQPIERIKEAAFVWFSIGEMTPTALAKLSVQNALLATGYFTMSTSYAERQRFVAVELPQLVAEFSQFLQSTDASLALRSRRIDYILHQDGDTWDPFRLGSIEKVLESGPFVLYRVLPITP